MKITELRVRGYRSLKDVSWRPGDLNVLIGPNGGGKSNLLRVLQLLQAAADGRLAKWVQREGGIVPMVWDGKATGIEMILGASTAVSVTNGADRSTRSYHLRIDRTPAGRFGIAEEQLSPALHAESATLMVPTDGALQRETTLSSAGSLPGADPVLGRFREWMRGWGMHHDFRTDAESPPRRGAVSQYETRLEPAGDNLVSVLHTLYTESRRFRQDMDDAMSAAFGGDFGELLFPPEADQRVQLRVRWKSMERAQSAADLSDGTIRFLHLLAILANPDPPPLIAIDEPETGLHPRMQHIVAEFAADAAGRTQVVLTTHSPEFLDCFEDTVPTTTVVEWQEGQGTTLRSLSGEALAEWVKHFSLGEIIRTGEAAIIESEEEG